MGITWSLPRIEGSPRDSPRPTSPASPSTTLSTPQGAGLRGPAASSNSSYVPCHQLLCASRLSAPARHIRSYPFILCAVPSAPLRESSVRSCTTHKILSILSDNTTERIPGACSLRQPCLTDSAPLRLLRHGSLRLSLAGA